MINNKLIQLNDLSIRVSDDDYLSLTDMVKSFPEKRIDNWLQNQSTLDFIEAFEEMYNPDFNILLFKEIKKQWSTLSIKKLSNCNLISIRSSAGRYGDTKAHKDIAFEFAMWLDTKFKLWVVREFQRLKDIERDLFTQKQCQEHLRKDIALEYSRMSKALEDIRLYNDKETLFYHYTNEANMINKLVCGMSSKECKELHGDTPRNFFTEKSQYFFELEMMNTSLILQGMSFEERKKELSSLLVKLPVIVQKKQTRLLK